MRRKKDICKIPQFSLEGLSTINLIDDLLIEVQKLSTELALKFPERVIKSQTSFGFIKLSMLWECDRGTIFRRVNKIKSGQYFKDKRNRAALDNLENIILQKYGSKNALDCVNIIHDYRNNKVNGEKFLENLLRELGRISGEINLTFKELSILLGYYPDYLGHVCSKILNPTDRDYNPNFQFSIEDLDQMINNLRQFAGILAKYCIEIIKKYKKSYPEIKEYTKQQHHVGYLIFLNL